VGFFKQINEDLKAEALVLVWYHPVEERFELTIPEQEVSGARVEPEDKHYTPPMEDATWQLWGHIHSHNTMAAFFSGTDDAGEQQDGLLFGVVGNITKAVPDCKFRTRVQGNWIEVALDQIIAPLHFPAPPKAWLDQVRPFRATPAAYPVFSNGYKGGSRFDNFHYKPSTPPNGIHFLITCGRPLNGRA
jgi:hypothetical protein